MAKMFYTAEEAAEKLGKTVDEIQEMASSGALQSFKQDDQDMFRVEQIDMMASTDDDLGDLDISLEDSGESDPLSLSGSTPAMDLAAGGSGDDAGDDGLDLDLSGGDIGLEDSAAASEDSFLAGSGVSAFEGGESAKQGDDLLDDDLSLETVGSGSGLLDLTRESDDTSLGAELLDEVYSSDDSGAPASASGLFEAVGGDSPMGNEDMGGVGMAASVPVVVETYEGGWSGLAVGMGIVAVVSLSLVGLMAMVSGTDTLPAISDMMAGNMLVWFGGLLGGLIIFGLLGFFIGKASE
ncbi:MAG: hypothetical protein CMJ34_05380 [Phycisphaerae bacterium]|nr:hypothetical protein [Phycisphaerae bacterium]